MPLSAVVLCTLYREGPACESTIMVTNQVKLYLCLEKNRREFEKLKVDKIVSVPFLKLLIPSHYFILFFEDLERDQRERGEREHMHAYTQVKQGRSRGKGKEIPRQTPGLGDPTT